MKTASATHKGNVRPQNEDSVYVNADKVPVIAIVADGMGGHAAGKTASKMTVSYIKRKLSGKNTAEISNDTIKKIVVDASKKLISAADKDDSLKSMGSTLVLAIVTQKTAKIVNVGDSRAYVFKKNKLEKITKDHSYVQFLVDNNVLTQTEADTHPYKHVITRAIGMKDVEADVYDIDFISGDTLLLCSDGLTEHVREEEITEILSLKISTDKKVSELIKLALERGGSDNVSVAVIENDEIIGRELQNRYKILEEIAEGGMSHVYAATCRKTNAKVAVKVFKDEMIDTPEALDGFKREAYICSKLHHKNIVKTIDVGKHDKLRYIVMEFIDGESLRTMLDNGKMDMQRSVDTIIRILEALMYAHSKGVVHKDLKPQNIIMQKDEPVIIDFGIAEDDSAGKAQRDAILGTIDYFSPEQAMGEPVDSRSDIYSVGIMLYELLTGKVPFSGADNVTIALKHLHQPAEAPKTINSEIPESLNKIILKAISKKKEDRYQNATAMVQDLKSAFLYPDGDYIQTEEELRQKEKQKQKKTIKHMIIGVAAVISALIVAIVYMLVFIASKGQDTNAEVYMPYLVDRNVSDVHEIMEKTGLDINVEIKYETRLDYEDDIIVAQVPSEGTVLSEGDTVTITVSSLTLKGGIMPDVIGQSEFWAKREIANAKIEEPTVLYKSGEPKDKGKVFMQSPDAGEVVTGSVVIYVYE
ncbi:MAG: Stp1/IreP family PP2C-type Ser/Thr phosphatase [Christensenellaceae bacterium]|nr:Stp1/IreP family PP2C-type Ser/Thr phosphatase [Christensenellaceae bacterium]